MCTSHRGIIWARDSSACAGGWHLHAQIWTVEPCSFEKCKVPRWQDLGRNPRCCGAREMRSAAPLLPLRSLSLQPGLHRGHQRRAWCGGWHAAQVQTCVEGTAGMNKAPIARQSPHGSRQCSACTMLCFGTLRHAQIYSTPPACDSQFGMVAALLCTTSPQTASALLSGKDSLCSRQPRWR